MTSSSHTSSAPDVATDHPGNDDEQAETAVRARSGEHIGLAPLRRLLADLPVITEPIPRAVDLRIRHALHIDAGH
ncbi:hypothetical protein [Williamsia sterculiae]|uniref:Uncharacterized protein n=1 Tax=Williamsia sterculiae TaxID=1344003 RepID=A0A1N7FGA5_9NOCA|nr:hypothetical protein [Williamsia sterculiae]SIR99352.1 hypothetical protein SAMN05445060_2040 [Williamsia sterculiae]